VYTDLGCFPFLAERHWFLHVDRLRHAVAYIQEFFLGALFLNLTITMSSSNSELDPVTAHAENKNITPQEKIQGLHKILEAANTGMLTTRNSDGDLHSRAMVPCSPFEPTQVNLFFIANNASHKFDEIENDSHVNVAFYDKSTTSWASFTGVAKITQDKALIEKFWHSTLTSYFGDLKDGKHHGNQDDPRVSIIEVCPTEIRYWVSTSTAIGRAAEVAYGALTGHGKAPGESRTITSDEIKLTKGLNTK